MEDLTQPEVIDAGQESDSPPDTGQKSDSPTDTVKDEAKTDKALPFDQDPKWIAARGAQKKTDALLDKHGYDDLDELQEALNKGNSLRELLGNRDSKEIKELIKKAARMDYTEEAWAQQEEEKREESETPEETIMRVKKERNEARRKIDKERSEFQERQDNDKLIKTFNTSMENAIEKSDLPDYAKPLAKIFAGVNHPINFADIGSKKERKEVADFAVNKLKEFEKAVIKNYVKGKKKIPDIPVDKGKPPPSEKTNKKLTRSEAKKVMFDEITRRFRS